MGEIEYKVDDCNLGAQAFVSFVNRIWPGNYDIEKTEKALSKTINITAYDGSTLTGCLRILTDGCYFGTITELLVLPEYQKKRDRKQAASACKGIYSDYAVFRRAARTGRLL